MPTIKLTEVTIKTLTSPGREKTYYWDAEVPSFGICVPLTGRKAYVFQFRDRGGRTRRISLGLVTLQSLEEARRKAKGMKLSLLEGHDPLRARRERKSEATVNDLLDAYVTRHLEVNVSKPSSVREIKRVVQYIREWIGPRPISTIEPKDFTALRTKLKDRPGRFNGIRAYWKAAWKVAFIEGLMKSVDPSTGVKAYPKKPRRRVVDEGEYKRLYEAMERCKRTGEIHPIIVHAVEALIFSGCRKMEILSLKRVDVDFARGCLTIREHKTDGAVGEKVVAMNPELEAVLRDVPQREGNPYVFWSPHRGYKARFSHIKELDDPWQKLCAIAGIADLHRHDLRRSFATHGLESGIALEAMSATLGHTNPMTTFRHYWSQRLKLKQAVATQTGKAIAGFMKAAPIEYDKHH